MAPKKEQVSKPGPDADELAEQLKKQLQVDEHVSQEDALPPLQLPTTPAPAPARPAETCRGRPTAARALVAESEEVSESKKPKHKKISPEDLEQVEERSEVRVCASAASVHAALWAGIGMSARAPLNSALCIEALLLAQGLG